MPTTPCLPPIRFDFHPHRAVDLTNDAPQTSSDGGLLLLRQLDERLGLSGRIAALLPDSRAPERVVHSRLEHRATRAATAPREGSARLHACTLTARGTR